MAEMRIEKDSMSEVEVPAEHYWGAQTQRPFTTSRSAVTPSFGAET